MPDFSAQSYNQSALVYYNTNITNPGIFIEWDRNNVSGVYSYKILRSAYFDGTYSLIDTVLWPINEYVDTGGTPSSYYKIQDDAKLHHLPNLYCQVDEIEKKFLPVDQIIEDK